MGDMLDNFLRLFPSWLTYRTHGPVLSQDLAATGTLNINHVSLVWPSVCQFELYRCRLGGGEGDLLRRLSLCFQLFPPSVGWTFLTNVLLLISITVVEAQYDFGSIQQLVPDLFCL